MDPRLVTLIDLQKAKGALYQLETQLNELPRQRAGVQAELDGLLAEADAAKEAHTQAELQQRRKEKLLTEVQEDKRKKDAQLFQIKSNKEYQASTIEIDTLKKRELRLEEEVVAAMEEAEKLAAVVEEKKAKAADKKGALQDRIDLLKAEEDRLSALIASARAEADEVATQVPPPLLKRFDRIFNGKQGVAMAAANEGHCDACHVCLTPHTIQLARRGQDFVSCEGCGRLLYWEADVDDAPVF